ncbi:unnamed protein product [Porites lobata]|uniref:THAP-type domain-containing protein n=1 Tax=Porites lobata TaxID=104759 RepID=A0ABN8NTA3_9CNID|nr:unnamed protein product [Porites lobata]
MVYCSVACCNNGNHNRNDLSYFIFPSDKRLGSWIKFCRRADKKFSVESAKAKAGKSNNLWICSAHFDPKAYRKTLNGRRKTYNTALPTIFRPNDECTPRSFSDCKTNTLLPSQVSLADADGEITTDLVDVRSSNADFCDVQHDHSYCLSAEDDRSSTVLLQDTEPEMVRSVVKNLKNRLNDKAKLKRDLFMEDVLENDDSVKFYTGIPTLGCFNLISELIKPEAEKLKYWDKNKNKQMKYQTTSNSKPGPKRSLTLTEELVLTLVRLRLGLMGRQLADTFSVSQSQLSRVFTTWVCFLASIFQEVLVLWPSKDEIKRNLPRSFNKYPNTLIIIDCTEMFIEKPTSPYAQRATWSEYKGHNTIKALVGITPLAILAFSPNFGLEVPVTGKSPRKVDW